MKKIELYGILEKSNQIDKIKKEAEKEIKKVRRNLLKLPTKTSGKCFDASKIIALNLMKKFKDCEFYLQHGEIAHSLNIPSKYWSIQHTWLKIKKGELVLYVDATCDQFRHLFKEIPDFYISEKKPKWFLNDEENLRFKYYKMHDFFNWLQFKVKGKTYDLISRKINGGKGCF